MQSVSAPKPPCVPENKLKALRVERVELSTKVEELREDANIEAARVIDLPNRLTNVPD